MHLFEGNCGFSEIYGARLLNIQKAILESFLPVILLNSFLIDLLELALTGNGRLFYFMEHSTLIDISYVKQHKTSIKPHNVSRKNRFHRKFLTLSSKHSSEPNE